MAENEFTRSEQAIISGLAALIKAKEWKQAAAFVSGVRQTLFNGSNGDEIAMKVLGYVEPAIERSKIVENQQKEDVQSAITAMAAFIELRV